MQKFDASLETAHEDDATSIESEDAVAFYEELYERKEKQRAALKTQLDELQKRKKTLAKKYVLADAFNREMQRTRESITQANAALHREILEAEEARRGALAKHMSAMEELEGRYSDFAELRRDPDSLKTKLAELKNKKLALQEAYENASEDLQRITESTKSLEMPLPNAEAIKRVAEEISTQCGDVAAKEQELEKLKRFLKEFQEKIYSN